MGCLGDDDHPDPSATALHKILDFFLFLIGVALIVFSAYYMAVFKTSSFFAIIILIVGVGAVVFTIVGFFGSGYYKGGEKEGRLICLRIFWLATLLFAIVLFMFGGICLISKETIQSYVLVYYGQFTDMSNQFGGETGTLIQQLGSLLNNFQILGAVAVGLGVYLLLCFFCSSYIMGLRIFLLTISMFGSIGIAAVGVLVIILSAYFQSYVEVMAHISKILYIGIILGVVSVISGAIGLVAYWLHKKLPVVNKIFTLIVIALGVAYFVVGILSFSLVSNVDNTLRDKITEICVRDVVRVGMEIRADESPCYELVFNSVTYECTRVRNAEMSSEICPFEPVEDPNNPPPDKPNCLCSGSAEEYIRSLPDIINFVDFSFLANKKNVVSNYKILGMLGLGTTGLLAFIAITLLMGCCCYPPKVLEGMEGDDDEYEWVYEDEEEEEDDDDKDNK